MELSAGRQEPRWAALAAIGLLLLVAGFWLTTPAPARAQEPAAEAAETPAEQAPRRANMFRHMVESAGIFFGLVILGVSIALVAIIVLLAMDLRLPVAVPPAFVEEFTETVNKRKFREAFELARNDSSILGRVLTVGMGRLQYGIEDAREAALNTVESLRASKEHLITYLATIGTLGPMLGLVGTVYGMIGAFMELGQPGRTPDAAKLASNISHALVVTLLGIALSVPAIFCHAFFRNRLTRITMDVSNIADDLLTQMYHNSRRPAGAATAPTDVRAGTPAATTKAAE
jgi:biopolymer transport protein ExbB